MPRSDKPVGYVAVDSGTVVIADPVYVMTPKAFDKAYDKLKFKVIEPPQSLRAAIEATGQPTDPEEWGRLYGRYDPQEIEPGFIMSRTYVGDGVYPVYAEFAEDGNVVALTIRFDQMPEEAGEDVDS